MAAYGKLALSAGYTKTHTRLEKTHQNRNGFTTVTRESEGYLEHGNPEDRPVLGAVHSIGPWTISCTKRALASTANTPPQRLPLNTTKPFLRNGPPIST